MGRNPYYDTTTTRTLTTRTTATRVIDTGNTGSRHLATRGYKGPGPRIYRWDESLRSGGPGGGGDDNRAGRGQGQPATDDGAGGDDEEKEKEKEEDKPRAADIVPEAPVPGAATHDAVKVTWRAVPGPPDVVGYRLFVSDGAEGPEDFSRCVHDGRRDVRTEYHVTDLRPGEPYRFVVSAVCKEKGPDGDDDYVETAMSPPSRVVATKDEDEARSPPGEPGKPEVDPESTVNGDLADPNNAAGAKKGVPGVTSDAIAVRWTEPKQTGGGAITGYVVQMRECPDAEGGAAAAPEPTAWAEVYDDESDTATRFVKYDLTPAKTYEFRVAAYNSVGRGIYSAPGARATTEPLDVAEEVPEPPEAPVAGEASPRTLQLKWLPPARTGGGDITGYKVYDQTGALVHDGSGSTATECAVVGLEPGTEYAFRVAAINSVGEGPASEPSAGAHTEKDLEQGVPAVPLEPKVGTVGDRHATVEWNAPAEGAGASPTGYRVYKAEFASEEEAVAAGDASAEDAGVGPYKVAFDDAGRAATVAPLRNLAPGTWHRFRVAAQNAAGEGPMSKATDPVVTQKCAPGAPGSGAGGDGAAADSGGDAGAGGGSGADTPVQVDEDSPDHGPHSLRVSWLPPVDAGGASPDELSYIVYRSPHKGEDDHAADAITVVARDLREKREEGGEGGEPEGPDAETGRVACTVRGLLEDTEYRFKVAAVNTVGEGPPSAAVVARTPVDQARLDAERVAELEKVAEERKREAQALEAEAQAKEKEREEAERAERERREAEERAEKEKFEAAAAERRAALRSAAEERMAKAKPVVGAVIEDEAGYDRVEIVTCKEGGAFHYGEVPEGCCCTHVAGTPVSGNKQFKAAVATHRPGDDVEFVFIWRDKPEESFKMTVMIGGSGIPIAEVRDIARQARGEFRDDE